METGRFSGQPDTDLCFSKMHGAGNDFVLLDLRQADPPSQAVCRALADRHTGVGCDLILGVKAPRNLHSVASFEIWTAEGAPAQQCGNGARCVAAWLVRMGLARGPRFTLDSPSDTHAVEVLGARSYRVAMGMPEFAPERIPLYGFPNGLHPYEADLANGLRIRFSAVSVGNPHAVIEVDDIELAPVAHVGRSVQTSPQFPSTINVGFTEIVSRDRIRLRVWEYGAGETLACGSGACAAAVTLMRQGRVDRGISVALPGGELHINWPAADHPIHMIGPAIFVYEGQFSYASVQ